MKEEMGMTDLQFKSWLKLIIKSLEETKNEETKEKKDERIETLIKQLTEDLQG